MPAEHCCGVCPLLQGVQIIASYTVAMGTFAMLSLLVRGPAEKPAQSTLVQIVEFIDNIYHVFALFAGMKGLLGVILKDARRLRSLLIWHCGEIVLWCVAFVFREVEACKELKNLQQLHQAAPQWDCHSIRVSLLVEFAVFSLLFSYFAYVIWSLVKRLEAGELGTRAGLDYEHEMISGGLLADPWLFVGSDPAPLLGPAGHAVGIAGHTRGSPSMSIALQAAGRHGDGAVAGAIGGVGPPRPFSGPTHRLVEDQEEEDAERGQLLRPEPELRPQVQSSQRCEAQSQESRKAFLGTPQRLE